jgi:hypothetical protein
MSSSTLGRTKLLNHVGVSRREMCASYAHLASEENGDVRYGGAYSFYLTCTKNSQQNILHGITPCASTRKSVRTRACTTCVPFS